MPSTADDGRYRERELLGSGGMATVRLADDMLLGRRVALKRVHAASDLRGVKRLRREALVGASLNHPNLVSVYDVRAEEDGDLVVVMQYVAGNTLRDVIRSRGALPVGEALRILEGVAAGLDAIHAKNIVHRDVKPANILLGIDGTVKVADLGIASVADRTQITTVGAVVGSFSYMAPEQLDGQDSDPAMDIYALAAVAFEMLCGQKARPEPNPLALAHAISTRPPPDLRAVWPEAAPAAARVLQRAMAPDPNQRPRTAGELVGRLKAALNPESTQPGVPPARVQRSEDSQRPALAAGAAGAIAAGAGAPGAGAAVAASKPRPRRGLGEAASSNRQAFAGEVKGTRQARIVPLLGLLLGLLAVGALVAALAAGGGTTSRHRTVAAAGSGTGPAAPQRHSGAARSASSVSASPAAGVTSVAKPSTSGAGAGSSFTGANASLSASTPAAVVQSFYEQGALHHYAAAWQLADANMRNQLAGFASYQAQMSSVRSITFHRAQTLGAQSASSATVELQTTSVQNDKIQQCAGTARTVRSSGGGWLLDGISINCTP